MKGVGAYWHVAERTRTVSVSSSDLRFNNNDKYYDHHNGRDHHYVDNNVYNGVLGVCRQG